MSMYPPLHCLFAGTLVLYLGAATKTQLVINAPPMIAENGVELMDGNSLFVGPCGEVGSDVVARSGSLVRVSGGTIGWEFRVDADSDVLVSGGHVSPGLTAGARSKKLTEHHNPIANSIRRKPHQIN